MQTTGKLLKGKIKVKTYQSNQHSLLSVGRTRNFYLGRIETIFSIHSKGNFFLEIIKFI